MTAPHDRELTVMNNLVIPSVVEETARGARTSDIFSRLLSDRIIVLGTPIDDNVANLITAQLLYLESQDPEKDVYLYINSPGGSITSLFAIYDTMQFIRPDVVTVVMGLAASAASVLLAAGAKGKRYAIIRWSPWPCSPGGSHSPQLWAFPPANYG